VTHFVYFYYLVLLLLTVLYGGKLIGLKDRNLIWPAILTISSFYVLRFTILGGKEIILMSLAMLGLYSLDKLLQKKEIDWQYLVFLAMTLGIATFINFSGTVVAGIIGFLFIFCTRYPLRLRLLATSTLVVLILLFGGFEAWMGTTGFIFNSSPLSQGAVSVDAGRLRQAELINYGLHESNIFWRGKLQAFTQPQFFGFIFIIWLVITITSCIKRHKRSQLENTLFLYAVVYFLIIMDPFSLNPHPYAYVLSISPKYSLMLVPMIAVILSGRKETVLYLEKIIPKNLIYLSGIFLLLLHPGIRNYLLSDSMKIISRMMPLTRDPEYYLSLINGLMIGLGLASLVLVLTAKYWQRHYAKLAAFGLLVIPTVFLLNSNFSFWKTMSNIYKPLPIRMVSGAVDENERDAFTLVNYVNDKISTDERIIFLFRDNRIGFFIKNNSFVVNNNGLKLINEY